MQRDGYRVTLALAEKDKAVLEYFAMKTYGLLDVVQYRKPTEVISVESRKRYMGKPQYTFRINCKDICTDLRSKGVIPAKSLILTFPTEEMLPRQFLWHFVRGYFEGDGSVRKPRNNHSSDVVLYGTAVFLGSLQDELAREGIKSVLIPARSIYSLGIYGVENMIKFSNLIYRDADFFLARKRERLVAIGIGRDRATSHNGSSQFRGITYKAKIKRFVARASIDRVRYNIGCFKTETEAYAARVAFLKQHSAYTSLST